MRIAERVKAKLRRTSKKTDELVNTEHKPKRYIPPWECTHCKNGPDNTVLLCAYHLHHGFPPRNRAETRRVTQLWRARRVRVCGARRSN